MATLEADVTARVSAQRLVELTNVNSIGASTADAAVLSAAVTDVQADFRIYAGVVYDEDDPRHVSVGIDGVLLKLQFFQNNSREEYQRWIEERLTPLRNVTNNDRVTPRTKSTLQPAPEKAGIQRPHFDPNSSFENTTPNRPA